MRPTPLLLALISTVACSQPAEPTTRGLEGVWTVESGAQALVPATLTLEEFGPRVSGGASIPGLDPAGPNGPVVSVSLSAGIPE